MSWPKFDFETKHVLDRKRSLTIRGVHPRKASSICCTEHLETSRRCSVVEINVVKQPTYHPPENMNAQSDSHADNIGQNENVDENGAGLIPLFDLSYCSPVLDNTFIKRAKRQEALMTPPSRSLVTSVVQSPDIFSSLSSPEESPCKNVLLPLRRPSDLSHRTPIRNIAIEEPGLMQQIPSLPYTQPHSPQRFAGDNVEEHIGIPQQGDSEPIISLDVGDRSDSTSDPSDLPRSKASQSLNPFWLLAAGPSDSTPPKASSSLDPFVKSESKSCSISEISTPTPSPRSPESGSASDSLFETSPVASLKKGSVNFVGNEVAPRILNPLQPVDADATLCAKPEIDTSREDSADSIWLDPNERFTIASYISGTEANASSTSPNISLGNLVSPIKTPPHSALQLHSSASLLTAVELNDVWERRIPARRNRLSKLAEVLRKQIQVLRSDIAMWKCDDDDDDSRRKVALRVHLDNNATTINWGIRWTSGFETTTRRRIAIADSVSINSNIRETNRYMDIYEPIVRIESDSTGLVLLAPRYCKCSSVISE